MNPETFETAENPWEGFEEFEWLLTSLDVLEVNKDLLTKFKQLQSEEPSDETIAEFITEIKTLYKNLITLNSDSNEEAELKLKKLRGLVVIYNQINPTENCSRLAQSMRKNDNLMQLFESVMRQF